MTGLGRIERQALILLASRPEGCASPDLAHLAERRSALHSLNALARRGFAERAGTRPSGSADGRGQPPVVFVITGAGLRLLGRAS